MELRVQYHEKLMETDHFPDWFVNFFPPPSLLNKQRAIEATVGYRLEASKRAIQTLSDLISHEINVAIGTLKMHYEHIDVRDYHLREAMDALVTFMR